jgi:hypothetical protein
MGNENPYKVQAKHVVGATSLFLLMLAVALGLDRLTTFLIEIHWIAKDGLYFWVFKIAEVVLLVADAAALITIVLVTTYKFLRGLLT